MNHSYSLEMQRTVKQSFDAISTIVTAPRDFPLEMFLFFLFRLNYLMNKCHPGKTVEEAMELFFCYLVLIYSSFDDMCNDIYDLMNRTLALGYSLSALSPQRRENDILECYYSNL